MAESFTMIMTGEDSQRYPKLRSYLEKTLPNLPSRKPSLYAVWQKYAPANEEKSKLDWPTLRWLWRPLVTVDSSQMMQCYDGRAQREVGPMAPRKVRWYGLTPDIKMIIIAEDLASLPGTPNEIILESTLLHEMVHWSRLAAGLSDWQDEDAPEAFEREAYGVPTTLLRSWNYCLPYELDPSASLRPYKQP
jgi:Metallopeptidase toxin 3